MSSKLTLERFAYTPTEVQGILSNPDGEQFYTIERPWIPGPHPGGASFESCVPDGNYNLIKHTRPDGTKTVALINSRLGVWYQADDRPDDWGRYLILIHAGNTSADVVGCVAPGLFRTIYNNKLMVTNSRVAMRRLKPQKYDKITIKSALGAKDQGLRA